MTKINGRFVLLVLSAAGLALLFHVVHLPGAWLFGSVRSCRGR